MLVNILTGIGVLLLIWMLYRGVKNNPQAFSRENLSKSFFTLGILALILIGLVSFTVLMLKR